MKHFINKINTYLILLVGLLIFSSCEEEKEAFRISDVKINPSNSSFTSLDDIVIDLEVEGSVSSLDVAQVGGDQIGSVSISNGEGTFTTSPANIEFNESGAAKLEFIASVEGGDQVKDVFEVSISNPISLMAPSGVVQNDMEKYFQYNIATQNASPENVMVEMKVNSGSYSSKTGDWAQQDSVKIVGSNYEVNDTIIVRVTATRGQLSAQMESSVVVGMYTLSNESDPIIFEGDSAYNLVNNSYVGTGTDSTDMRFVLGALNTNQLGFESNNGTQFVTATMDDYNTGNVQALKTKYENGSKMSGVSDVEKGDVFIYHTTRNGHSNIGIFKVVGTTRTNDDNSDSFTFQYKY